MYVFYPIGGLANRMRVIDLPIAFVQPTIKNL